jgi:putative membrane protein
VSTQYTAYTPEQYMQATGGALIGGVVAFLLSLGLARVAIGLLTHASYQTISWATLALLVVVVGGLTGIVGLGICAVAAGIGLLPVLWGARRMNAMGVLLLPIALNMAGAGDAVARILGLLG